MKSFKTAFLLIFAAFSLSLIPGGSTPAQENAIEPPQPENQAPPEFSRPDREAWVHVRYTIADNGSTTDVEIIDGFSNSLFDDAALRTVRNWEFSPATASGEPISLLNQQYILGFSRTGEFTISGPVRNAYEQITEQLGNEEYEAVAGRIRTLLDGDEVRTIFDYVFLNNVLVNAYLGLERQYEALDAARKATIRIGPVGDSPGPAPRDILPRELLIDALRKRFLLEGNLSQNVQAMRTYQRLLDTGALADDDPVHAQAEAIQEAIDSSDSLGQLARIGEAGLWNYVPDRRILAVTNVENGSIDTLDLYCQRRQLQLEFQSGVEWTLPDVLGQCELIFTGEPGTEFVLYEFVE